MLKYFYDCCPAEGTPGTGAANPYKKLFHSLAISKAGKQYLEKSLITGIMRIAKESIFPGLNNPGVYAFVRRI